MLALAVGLINPLGKADSGLKLHPDGFGQKSYAAWKAKQGRPDSTGNADHALYFQKMTTTATFAAGVAVITGAEGLPVAQLGLSWEHRRDGHCGAGAPRWNVGVTGQSGATYTVFLGCAAATHEATTDLDWEKNSYVGLGSVTTNSDILLGTVRSLAIVFDEGTDVGPGFVYLDNITVNAHVWTSPADNGS
jgi:hypothetical protein